VEQLVTYLADTANWQGQAGIPNRLFEHLTLALLAVATASAVALPLGFYIGHTGKLQLIGINLANIGRAVPSYAVMVMLLPVMLGLAPVLGYDSRLGLTFLPIFLAMTLLAIPPILVATYAGIGEVDRDLREASRAMGLTERQVLTGVELPLAIPTIMGGVRTASVNIVATSTIGSLAGVKTLGDLILSPNVYGNEGVIAGAIVVALLALTFEFILAGLQHLMTPRGLTLQRAAARVSA